MDIKKCPECKFPLRELSRFDTDLYIRIEYACINCDFADYTWVFYKDTKFSNRKDVK